MKGRQKTRAGRVVSDKMDKTVVLVVETRKAHPFYRRVITVRKKYKAHDEHNACRAGDLVQIVETRPLSKEKRWRVDKILVRGHLAEIQPGDIAVVAEEKARP